MRGGFPVCHAFFIEENNMNISEKDLIELIKNNTLEVFGEKITWTKKQVTIKEGDNRLLPDIFGIDTEGRIVIVEVKAKVYNKANLEGANVQSAGEAVGQILHYASAYIRDTRDDLFQRENLPNAGDDLLRVGIEKLRLFIVIQDPSLKTLHRACTPCELLRAHGVDICCKPLFGSQITDLYHKNIRNK